MKLISESLSKGLYDTTRLRLPNCQFTAFAQSLSIAMKMTVGPSYLKHIRLTGEQLARDMWSSHPNAYTFYHHSLQVMLTTLGKLEARALRLRSILRKPLGYRLWILSETR